MKKNIKQIRTRTSARTPRAKSDEEFSFSEDAFNSATESLPLGFQMPPEMPDIRLSKEERNELLRKSLPDILGENTEMAWVFVFMVFEGESIRETAGHLEAITGKRYFLKDIKALYLQALRRVAVLFDEAAKKVCAKERLKKAKSEHGRIH